MPNKWTTDNVIILQEEINSMCKSKKKQVDMIFKLDLEKACDHVNWDFLEVCLKRNGFPPITIKLIMHWLTSSDMFILWNGRRLPNFIMTRGLQKGDPLQESQ